MKTRNWQYYHWVCIVSDVSEDAQKPEAGAWQPFSFGGVAAFATAGWLRVFAAQGIAALIVSSSVVWFLWRNYSPVIGEAIDKMPAAAMVSGGRLQGISGSEISENRFLAIAVTSQPALDFGQSADTQIELRGSDIRVSSLFRSLWGSIDVPYGRVGKVDLSRTYLEPRWWAWRPILFIAAGIAIMLFLLLLWTALAAVYAPAAKFIAWLTDRKLSWSGARRLCAAALVPGALVLALGVLLHGWRILDLIGFGSVAAAHVLIGCVYVAVSPAFAPRLFPPDTQNPFAAAAQPTDSTD